MSALEVQNFLNGCVPMNMVIEMDNVRFVFWWKLNA